MFIVICPHCSEEVIIEEVNCAIFRHGIFKENYQQIPPHAPKELCDQWVKDGVIYGCGKPFRLVGEVAEVCDYI